MSSASLIVEQTPNRARLRVLRHITSFPGFLSALLVVLAVSDGPRARFNDPDMWWHLSTGHFIWTTRTIPLGDLFSYATDSTSPDSPRMARAGTYLWCLPARRLLWPDVLGFAFLPWRCSYQAMFCAGSIQEMQR